MTTETPDFKDREAFDDSERELCPDGNCTGLIGSDGRCKVCGLSLDGTPTSGYPTDAPHSADAPHSELAAGGRVEDVASALDDDRQLCSDGNCLGLIGSDGKCKVCGRPAAS
jgi:hypothetical protein